MRPINKSCVIAGGDHLQNTDLKGLWHEPLGRNGQEDQEIYHHR